MSHVEVTSAPGWAEACSSAFVPLRVRSASSVFNATLEQHVLSPEVSLTRVASTASEVYRSDQVIAQHPRDDLLISFHRSGTGSVAQHGREARLRTGSAALYDASCPYTLSFPSRMSEIVLQLPRRALPAHRGSVADLTARSLPDGSLLTALTALAASAQPGASSRGRDDEVIADAMISLLGALISSASDSPTVPLDVNLLGTAMRRFVDEHLADPELTPEYLAHAHHVSLRLVQRIFAETGDSPSAHIRRRRLEAGRRMVSAGVPVARAAHRSGFHDPDTFSRAYKREFGVSPSTQRRVGPSPES